MLSKFIQINLVNFVVRFKSSGVWNRTRSNYSNTWYCSMQTQAVICISYVPIKKDNKKKSRAVLHYTSRPTGMETAAWTRQSSPSYGWLSSKKDRWVIICGFICLCVCVGEGQGRGKYNYIESTYLSQDAEGTMNEIFWKKWFWVRNCQRRKIRVVQRKSSFWCKEISFDDLHTNGSKFNFRTNCHICILGSRQSHHLQHA